jgi:hypothetical protein
VTKKGGTIIMRCGDLSAQAFDPKVVLPKNIWADLINSLDLAHKAGILQCDLRRSNFVRFNDSWQLVDYSLSCEANSENPDEMEPGAQLECAGIGVRNLHKTNGPIYWTRIDDYQMLIANVMPEEALAEQVCEHGEDECSRSTSAPPSLVPCVNFTKMS